MDEEYAMGHDCAVCLGNRLSRLIRMLTRVAGVSRVCSLPTGGGDLLRNSTQEGDCRLPYYSVTNVTETIVKAKLLN